MPKSRALGFFFYFFSPGELLLHSVLISIGPEETKSTLLVREESSCFPLDSGSSDEVKSLLSITAVWGFDRYCL